MHTEYTHTTLRYCRCMLDKDRKKLISMFLYENIKQHGNVNHVLKPCNFQNIIIVSVVGEIRSIFPGTRYHTVIMIYTCIAIE